MPAVDPKQPLVILGGFLITDEAYEPMADWLRQEHQLDVAITPAGRLDWLSTTWAFGWRRLLDRVDALVREQQTRSPSGQVTLIGHSSGGVMLRLYLSREPFAGRVYAGAERCNRLITLGSPHQAVRATPLRAMVDRRFPGCHEAGVDYLAVAGELDLNGPMATAFSRRSARGSYRSIVGEAEARGDGLVPLSSALLAGARQLVLPATAHGGLFGTTWYGSPERLALWWDAATAVTT
jgi:pimeloyl-ACP methyl ester carboxylesterase